MRCNEPSVKNGENFNLKEWREHKRSIRDGIMDNPIHINHVYSIYIGYTDYTCSTNMLLGKAEGRSDKSLEILSPLFLFFNLKQGEKGTKNNNENNNNNNNLNFN